MKFPGKVDICLICDANCKIVNDDYNFCESCRIYYGLLIYSDNATFIIWDDGIVYFINYLDQSNNKELFHIDESENFKEVMYKINKLLIFS